MEDFDIVGGVLFGYNGPGGEVDVPYGVVKIYNEAFARKNHIKKVTLPSTVKEIGSLAFVKCEQLQKINIPGGVREIGHRAFAGCSALERIIIPEGVEEIVSMAFEKCRSLKSVRISSGVKKIGAFAFEGCTELEWLTVPEAAEIGERAFYGCRALARDTDFVIVRDALYTYYGCDDNVVIPPTVRKIGSFAFSNSGVVSVVIPKGVTEISANAFSGCKRLKHLSLPSSIEKMGYNAFRFVDELVDIEFPDDADAAYFERLFGIAYDSGLYYALAINLMKKYMPIVKKSAMLKRKIKTLKDFLINMAFESDSATLLDMLFSLYRVIGVDELDALIEMAEDKFNIRAFLIEYKNLHYTAERLEEIETEKIEKELGFRDRTPADWRKIFRFHYEDGGVVITGCFSDDPDLVVPEFIGTRQVVKIGKDAFRKATWLTSVTLPESVTKIGARAFFCCENMTEINIPSGVTSIGDHTFGICHSLASINIPDGVKEIGREAFWQCRSLTKITLPDGLTQIGMGAFDGCTNLESINIPDGVEQIPYKAFNCCERLVGVVIPESVEEIGYDAFSGCNSLTEINLPDNGIVLESGAFAYCKNLECVTIPESVIMVVANAFVGCEKVVIVAPKDSWAEKMAKAGNLKFIAE